MVDHGRLAGFLGRAVSDGLKAEAPAWPDVWGRPPDWTLRNPKRVALSRSDRRLLLTQKYTPAREAGTPVKSILLLRVSGD